MSGRDGSDRGESDRGESGGSFEERLRTAQGRQAAGSAPASDAASVPSAMGIGMRVGVELVSALVVGMAIGWALDWALGTRPWMLILFVLLGGGAGVANVWRLMMPRAGTGR